jgi:type IV secretory pathway TrbF-like protein
LKRSPKSKSLNIKAYDTIVSTNENGMLYSFMVGKRISSSTRPLEWICVWIGVLLLLLLLSIELVWRGQGKLVPSTLPHDTSGKPAFARTTILEPASVHVL